MNKYFKKYFNTCVIAVLASAFTVACGNNRHVEETEKVKRKNAKELKKALERQAEIPFDFFSCRIGVDLKNKDQDNSFSTYIKLNVDSAFGGTIKKAAYVAATYMATTDSIWYTNKAAKCYFAENLNYVSSLFGTTIEFDFFQDLILGLPIGYEEDAKYQQIPATDHYILSSHKERDYKRLENERLNIEDDLMLIQYHLYGEDELELKRIEVQIPADSTTITVNYLERKDVDGHLLPEETTVEITHPNDVISIRLNYGTIKLNEPKTIKIKIPDSYVECP